MTAPIDTRLVPAAIREQGPQAVELYAAALQFEGVLMAQITEQMLAGEGEGVAGGGAYGAMLPQSLADGVTAGGGLGLAGELYRAMATRAGLAAAGTERS